MFLFTLGAHAILFCAAGTFVSDDSQGQGTQVTDEDLTRAQAAPFYALMEYIFRKVREVCSCSRRTSSTRMELSPVLDWNYCKNISSAR